MNNPERSIGLLARHDSKPYQKQKSCKTFGCNGSNNKIQGRKTHISQENCPNETNWNNLTNELNVLSDNIKNIQNQDALNENQDLLQEREKLKNDNTKLQEEFARKSVEFDQMVNNFLY